MIAKNKKIKQELIKRWKQLGLFSENEEGRMSYQEIIKDAKERSPEMKITSDRISKWLTDYEWGGKKQGLTDEQVIYLCKRWSINIEHDIMAGDIKIDVLPYNESQALKNIKK